MCTVETATAVVSSSVLSRFPVNGLKEGEKDRRILEASVLLHKAGRCSTSLLEGGEPPV